MAIPAYKKSALSTAMQRASIAIFLLIAAVSLLFLTSCSASNDSSSSEATSNDSSSIAEATEPSLSDATPYGDHGALSVQGKYLIDSLGIPYQLRGMSTHGIAWFPQYVNSDAFKTLRDEWHTNCVRLAMYTDEYGGYCSGGNQAELEALVDEGVTAAIDLGMYVIVDWHVLNDHNPLVHADQAKVFFDKMSQRYAGNPNVLFEICNEPNSGATWADIKAYANEIIPIIRANAPDSIIIVGTPTWSQDVDVAAQDPLTFDNVMYALHFYAATHTQWLRDRVQTALDADLPIFVSEFGLCDASGSGGNDLQQAAAWLDFLDANDISYIAWNLSNKDETSAVILPSCDKTADWGDADLSESGQWLKSWFSARWRARV